MGRIFVPAFAPQRTDCGPRHKVKALLVVHNLRVIAGQYLGHNIIHTVGKGQEQIVGFALAQHLGEITLAMSSTRTFLPFMARPAPGYRRRCFCPRRPFDSLHLSPWVLPYWGSLLFHRFSRLRRNRRLCTGIEKAAFSMQKRRPIQMDNM